MLPDEPELEDDAPPVAEPEPKPAPRPRITTPKPKPAPAPPIRPQLRRTAQELVEQYDQPEAEAPRRAAPAPRKRAEHPLMDVLGWRKDEEEEGGEE